jgi:hypothetical protein
MPPVKKKSAKEKRKYVRVNFELNARLNKEGVAMIKELSAGGCLIETSLQLAGGEHVGLGCTAFGKTLDLDGTVIYHKGPTQYGIRFTRKAKKPTPALLRIIEQQREFLLTRRHIRVEIRRNALVDKEDAILLNVSAQGCFIETSAPSHIGDIVEVKFALAEHQIHLAAQVRWKNNKGIGVEYLSPDPEQVSQITDFIVYYSRAAREFAPTTTPPVKK